MVAVDGAAAGLAADPVELVAEGAHIGGGVLVPGDDLVNGVQDDGVKALAADPADELRHQPVQRQGVAAQVPDDNVLRVGRRDAQRAVDLQKAVDGRGGIDLQIHIQDPPLQAGKAQPGPPLGDGDAELHQQEALARLAAAREQHLVPAAQDHVRLCLEMQHKILNAELSLRASLAREETRGLHYRTDFPYRDDENFLCFITLTKNAEGGMDIEKIPVKDEWKGDLTEDYKTRYTYYFPKELETLGLPAEEETGGWGGKK